MKIISRLGAMALALSMLAGCAGGGSSSSAPSSASSSAAGSGTEQLPPMDLSQVSDPCLAVSGLAGETVVAQVGGEDITADLLLYWLSYGIELYLEQMGGYFTELPWDTDMGDGTTLASQIKDSALEAAAFYALLPTLGRNEGLTPSPDAAAAAEISATMPSTGIKMAIAVVGVLPILIVYPFFQQYFVKGITIGAVKG